jgi:hypothetical protein
MAESTEPGPVLEREVLVNERPVGVQHPLSGKSPHHTATPMPHLLLAGPRADRMPWRGPGMGACGRSRRCLGLTSGRRRAVHA